jgi:hypothetical protein
MAVLSAGEKLCCARKPARAIRIHLDGAAIHFIFTSLTLALPLRCCQADESIGRTGAGVTSDDSRRIQMNTRKVLGLAAVGGLLVLAAPAERAQALSLGNPGAAAAIQDGSQQMTTEVHWRRWHRHRWHHWRHWRRW